jgi:hypothetical protein
MEARTLINPYPTELLGEAALEALEVSALFTWAGEREGLASKTSAAAPAASGVAMLVPSIM